MSISLEIEPGAVSMGRDPKISLLSNGKVLATIDVTICEQPGADCKMYTHPKILVDGKLIDHNTSLNI